MRGADFDSFSRHNHIKDSNILEKSIFKVKMLETLSTLKLKMIVEDSSYDNDIMRNSLIIYNLLDIISHLTSVKMLR